MTSKILVEPFDFTMYVTSSSFSIKGAPLHQDIKTERGKSRAIPQHQDGSELVLTIWGLLEVLETVRMYGCMGSTVELKFCQFDGSRVLKPISNTNSFTFRSLNSQRKCACPILSEDCNSSNGSNNVFLVKIDRLPWYTIYHQLPVVKGANKPLHSSTNQWEQDIYQWEHFDKPPYWC